MQIPNENGRRAIFWIEAFLAGSMFILGWFVLPKDKNSKPDIGGIDWLGALLSIAGLALLTYDLA